MKKLCLVHINQIATPIGTSARRGKEMNAIRKYTDSAIYIEDDIIQKVGSTEEIMESVILDDTQIIDCSGKCAVPGFVDSHTHFIFGGYRPEEFLARLSGAQYMEIMKMGGGIMATVNATRNASFEELYSLGRDRLAHMLSQGITTVEGKSGYGLDFDCEWKQLKVLQKLNQEQPIEIVSTFLGGHALPPEYAGQTMAYLDFMLDTVLPAIKKENLATFCDIFCEDEVFSIKDSEYLLTKAKDLGFLPKIHADEIVNLGGGALAAELNAVSADHLLMISDESIAALQNSSTVTTLLPCTAFCLDKPYAPARKLIDAQLPVALASDFNPGSCFCNHIPLLLALAVIHMHMTLEESLTALTLNGAAALNLAEQTGSIEAGKKADINLLSYPSYEYLIYNTGTNIIDTVIKGGTIAYERQTPYQR